MAPRVLLVEDDAAIRRRMRFVLCKGRFVPFDAASGDEALTLARERIPDAFDDHTPAKTCR